MIDKTFGHYDVTGKIGEGGMGQVYSAMDSRLQRRVALKVLPESMVADPERLQRFEREAQLLASLNHPNIATLHGIEEVDGQIALVMELIEGEDLSERIQRGALPAEEAARIAAGIASALESAHDKGIIHRDLKPGNVKLGKNGVVKVLDFGLAKAMEGARSPTNQDLTNSPTISLVATQAGIILGTAAYMSPEQAAGQDLDRRCDIWSFGVVFYEMLTGSRPFEGETLSHTLADVLRGQIDWDRLPAETPAALRRLLARCLERDPRRRLRDMGEARFALEEWLAAPEAGLDGETGKVADAAPAPAGWRARLPWALLAAALAALAFNLIVMRPPPPKPTKPVRFNVELGRGTMYASVGSGTVLSPEGEKLAFVVGRGGNENRILLRELDQLKSRELAEGVGTVGVYNPFFSPDGEWLGYVSPTALMKVRTSGGSSMTLTAINRSRGAAWGPDDQIVFAAGPNEGLSILPATGGNAVALTTLDEAARETSHRWPSFLPDGRNVLFSSITDGTSWDDATLEVIDLETRERRVVFRGGTSGTVLKTGHLVYASRGSLFAVPFDLKRLETYGSAGPVVEEVGTSSEGGAHYSVSSNGTLVYLSGVNNLPEYPIQRIGRGGARETIWEPTGNFAVPRVSPDGQRLTVTRLLNGNWDVWVLDLQRGSETRLTFSESDESDSVWSPDGKFIVFSSNRETGRDALYRKRSDGSGQEELIASDEEQGLYASSWSKDGRYLAMGTGGLDLLTLDLEEGGGLEPFLESAEFSEGNPSFSPDGRWIAYDSDESGVREVYVRPFPVGGGKWQISAGGGVNPGWTADGRRIVYLNNSDVMEAEVNGREDSFTAERPRALFEANVMGGLGGLSLGPFVFTAFDVTADGSVIAFPADAGGASLDHATFVLNWTEELARTMPTR